jgi:hypothetical protein
VGTLRGGRNCFNSSQAAQLLGERLAGAVALDQVHEAMCLAGGWSPAFEEPGARLQGQEITGELSSDDCDAAERHRMPPLTWITCPVT